MAPFTATRPLRMISSAFRREAIPAAAKIFCSRSSKSILRVWPAGLPRLRASARPQCLPRGALLPPGGGLFRGRFFQSQNFLGTQQTVTAGRRTFDGERPERNAFHLFHRMVFAEKHVAQILLAAAAHASLIPIVGAVAARCVGLAQRLQMRANLLAKPGQFFPPQHAFDLMWYTCSIRSQCFRRCAASSPSLVR